MPSEEKALKWTCRLNFARIDGNGRYPVRVYPQSNDEGWRLPRLPDFCTATILQSASQCVVATKSACGTRRNVRLHKVVPRCVDVRKSLQTCAEAGTLSCLPGNALTGEILWIPHDASRRNSRSRARMPPIEQTIRRGPYRAGESRLHPRAARIRRDHGRLGRRQIDA